MPQSGIQSVTVPGCVEGWEKLHRKFGKLPWRNLFQPAIYYAVNGFPVTELIADGWSRFRDTIQVDESGKRIFLPQGRAPKTGTIFRNPELARALTLIAEGGADAFYRGPIAKAILRTSDRLGGAMAGADLSEFQAEWVEPISTEYRGWTVPEVLLSGHHERIREWRLEQSKRRRGDAGDPLR